MQPTGSQRQGARLPGQSERATQWKPTATTVPEDRPAADDTSKRTSLRVERSEIERLGVATPYVIDRTHAGSAAPPRRAAFLVVEAILRSTSLHVVMLDRSGTVIFVNRPEWSRTDNQHRLTCSLLTVGVNYLDVCRQAAAHGSPAAQQIAEAIQNVVNGGNDTLTCECRLEESGDATWLRATVVPLPSHSEVAAAVLHENATAQKQLGMAHQKRAAMERQLAGLSSRERDILGRIIAGKPNKVIAFELDVSPKTVEKHRASLMKKLRVKNAAELVRCVVGAGVSLSEE